MKSIAESDPVPPKFAPPPQGTGRGPSSNGTSHVNGTAPRHRAAPPRAPARSASDWWPLASAVGRNWFWLVLATAICAALGVKLGKDLWGTGYTATAQLVRYDTPDPELFQPRQIAPTTLAGIIASAEVRARAGARMEPALTAQEVAGRVSITPERNTDILNVSVSGPDPAASLTLANAYAEESVRFTQQIQTQDASDAAGYLRQQLASVEAEMTEVRARLQAAPPAAVIAAAAAPSVLTTRLEEARLELANLLGRYTDLHPRVQEQRARVAAFEAQVAPPDPASSETITPAMAPGEYEMLLASDRALENRRLELSGQLQLAEMRQENPTGYYQLFAPAVPEAVVVNDPTVKIALLAAFLGICGLMLATSGAVTGELFDRRLKTPADVSRVTRLPVIGRLAPTSKMTQAQQSRWAFRAWMTLQSRLSGHANEGLVCGITSSTAGEGRSHWIKLLAEAAGECGFRVITITTKPPESENTRRPNSRSRTASMKVETARGEARSVEPVFVHEAVLSDHLLTTPNETVKQLLAPEGASVVHLPLPGWVRNLDRRKEWLASLNTWSMLENVVILVELPPASEPESVLLAQNLPNVLWLTDCTRADAVETARQLETLRHARCNLVGAVMNRCQDTNAGERFTRWAPTPAAVALALLALALPSPGQAQTTSVDRSTFSIVSPEQRAEWQRELTLGPGDVLRLALYGEPTLARDEVTIQPDGRISFLEARDIEAAGLTIDQLRTRLDEQLAEFRRAPRTMISPVAFNSKRYYMLGRVVEKGSFTLDRPLTVVEAVARARGFETTFSGGDVVDTADLSHAFLVRDGRRAEVNFEQLFNSGDLSQNIAIEPGDYLYFPPADVREVYVLGEVAQPGPATLTGTSSTLRAVASRGGFTNRAWRHRVLVVRGSLNQPQAMVVNLADVLNGRAPDVELEPRDIIYVSARPWIKAEELLDEAASAFTQAFMVYWTSDKIIPVVPLR